MTHHPQQQDGGQGINNKCCVSIIETGGRFTKTRMDAYTSIVLNNTPASLVVSIGYDSQAVQNLDYIRF